MFFSKRSLILGSLMATFLLILSQFRVETTWGVSNSSQVEAGLSYLRTQQESSGQIQGFSGVTDWAAMAFSAAGVSFDQVASTGGTSLRDYLLTNPPSSSASSTDWSRKILAITAADQDPSSFGGTDYLNSLKNFHSDSQIGNASYLNDDIFGVLALLSANESTTSAVVSDTVSFILNQQNNDGGFSWLVGSTSDIDDTAATIMALKAFESAGGSSSNLATSLEGAQGYLESAQNADGGFPYDPNPETSWDTSSNVSSSAWVLMAFNSLGLTSGSETDAVTNYLLSTQQTDGSFPYQPAYPPGDTFDTSYAVLALTGEYWPINIYSASTSNTEVTTTPTPTPTPTSSPTPTSTPTETPTPTPTATPTDTPTPTTTSTPTPTLTPLPTRVPGSVLSAQIKVTPTDVPSLPSVTPKDEGGERILGEAKVAENSENQSSLRFLLSGSFLALAMLFAALAYWFFRLKR